FLKVSRLLSPTVPVVASIDGWNLRCAQDINNFTDRLSIQMKNLPQAAGYQRVAKRFFQKA
ncbi:MAG TPA: hypothetical protein VH985_01340, partial [Candidatus Binatia bacterium]